MTASSGGRVWISLQFHFRDKKPASGGRRTTEAVIDGFLLDHRAKLEPEGGAWLLRYPLASAGLHEKHSFEAKLPIVGETREDALTIAELVLRGHEPPEIPAEPRASLLLLLRLPLGCAGQD